MEPTATDPVAPAAAPEATPAAPAEPTTPTPPAQPAEPPKTPEMTPEETEAKEWDDANEEIFPGISKSKKEGKKDEPAKPGEKPKEDAADKTADEAPKPGEESAQAEAEGDESDTSVIDARIAARQTAREVEDVKADVRKRMFADAAVDLKDADGDPIKGVEDVMRLIDPRTGENFTQEAAETWLIGARQQQAERMQQMDSQISQIAEVNVGLKDEADLVNLRYGALLKEKPALRDQLWAAFEKTLEKDEKTGIITKSPVSLLEFYTTTLEPHVEMGRQAEAKEEDNAAAAAEEAKKAEEEKKRQTRQDRSDIYGGGNADNPDPDDKEWAEAAEAVFGPKH